VVRVASKRVGARVSVLLTLVRADGVVKWCVVLGRMGAGDVVV